MKLFQLKKIFLLLIPILCFSAVVHAQITVTGKIVNKENKEAIEGASILEKGTQNGISTDASGNFTIKVKSSNAILVFRYVGMKSVERKASDKMDIEMNVDNSTLSDIVVSATLQPVRKLETTTAIDIVNSKTLRMIKPESVAEAIQAVPGIYINNSQGRRAGIVTRGFPEGNLKISDEAI